MGLSAMATRPTKEHSCVNIEGMSSVSYDGNLQSKLSHTFLSGSWSVFRVLIGMSQHESTLVATPRRDALAFSPRRSALALRQTNQEREERLRSTAHNIKREQSFAGSWQSGCDDIAALSSCESWREADTLSRTSVVGANVGFWPPDAYKDVHQLDAFAEVPEQHLAGRVLGTPVAKTMPLVSDADSSVGNLAMAAGVHERLFLKGSCTDVSMVTPLHHCTMAPSPMVTSAATVSPCTKISEIDDCLGARMTLMTLDHAQEVSLGPLAKSTSVAAVSAMTVRGQPSDHCNIPSLTAPESPLDELAAAQGISGWCWNQWVSYYDIRQKSSMVQDFWKMSVVHSAWWNQSTQNNRCLVEKLEDQSAPLEAKGMSPWDPSGQDSEPDRYSDGKVHNANAVVPDTSVQPSEGLKDAGSPPEPRAWWSHGGRDERCDQNSIPSRDGIRPGSMRHSWDHILDDVTFNTELPCVRYIRASRSCAEMMQPHNQVVTDYPGTTGPCSRTEELSIVNKAYLDIEQEDLIEEHMHNSFKHNNDYMDDQNSIADQTSSCQVGKKLIAVLVRMDHSDTIIDHEPSQVEAAVLAQSFTQVAHEGCFANPILVNLVGGYANWRIGSGRRSPRRLPQNTVQDLASEYLDDASEVPGVRSVHGIPDIAVNSIKCALGTPNTAVDGIRRVLGTHNTAVNRTHKHGKPRKDEHEYFAVCSTEVESDSLTSSEALGEGQPMKTLGVCMSSAFVHSETASAVVRSNSVHSAFVHNAMQPQSHHMSMSHDYSMNTYPSLQCDDGAEQRSSSPWDHTGVQREFKPRSGVSLGPQMKSGSSTFVYPIN